MLQSSIAIKNGEMLAKWLISYKMHGNSGAEFVYIGSVSIFLVDKENAVRSGNMTLSVEDIGAENYSELCRKNSDFSIICKKRKAKSAF